jgi:hypothetical protein
MEAIGRNFSVRRHGGDAESAGTVGMNLGRNLVTTLLDFTMMKIIGHPLIVIQRTESHIRVWCEPTARTLAYSLLLINHLKELK